MFKSEQHIYCFRHLISLNNLIILLVLYFNFVKQYISNEIMLLFDHLSMMIVYNFIIILLMLHFELFNVLLFLTMIKNFVVSP